MKADHAGNTIKRWSLAEDPRAFNTDVVYSRLYTIAMIVLSHSKPTGKFDLVRSRRPGMSFAGASDVDCKMRYG